MANDSTNFENTVRLLKKQNKQLKTRNFLNKQTVCHLYKISSLLIFTILYC